MSETQTPEQTIDAPTKMSDLGRAVSVVDRGRGHAVAAPSNLNQQIEFAKLMSTSGPMIGKPFRGNVGACLGIANQAWHWGMNPFVVSQKAYLVNDIIAYEAQLVMAVLLTVAPLSRRPRYRFEGEGAERVCICTFWIKGEDEPVEHRSPKFSQIKPKNSPLWVTDPDQQQSYYTGRAGGRLHFPDVLMGVYDTEEIEGVVIEAAKAQQAITLGASVAAAEAGGIEDVDFTDVGKQIERKAKEKAAKADKKRAASKDGPPGAGDGATGEAPPQSKPDESAPATAERSQGPDPDEPDEDEQLVAGVEADEKAAKGPTKGKAITAAKGALTRIAETSTDEALAERANALLNKYED